MPLLTIAIPHFDNTSGLLETLDAVSKQQNEDLEIIVSDNATGSQFNKIKPILETVLPNLIIFENKQNLGFDANVELCVRHSRGQFVWLLGSGDIPKDGAVSHLLTVINSHSDAASILIDVHVNAHTPSSRNALLRSSFQILKPHEGNICISSLYRSAISGNIVNRAQWLSTTKQRLIFKNWCHVERGLKMYAKPKTNPFSVATTDAMVTVARDAQGWWNQDDTTFLYNVLIHRKILLHYHTFSSFKDCCLPKHCNSFNATVLKAMLFSRSIAQAATASQKDEISALLSDNKILSLQHAIIGLVPKVILRMCVRFNNLLRVRRA